MFKTFELWKKTSIQAHEHATLRFRNGTVAILSREETRSVARKWDTVGEWNGSKAVRFTEDSFATRMVATQLQRMGWDVTGIRLIDGEFGAIIVLDSDGRTTNPESIRGRIRDRNPGSPTDKRRKVQASFGRMGVCDISAMRAAIEARRK